MLRLCSASTSRAKILEDASVEFIQSPVGFDEEQIVAVSAKNFVYQATLGKYEEAMKIYDYKEIPLLVADTVVTAHDKILRKARCKDDARNILMSQSGSKTSIITCMIYHSEKVKIVDIASTDYIFNKFDMDKLELYLDSGEWRGKAGACMVEGFCKKYIREVIGYESCAMGLSVETLKAYM
jgi:septum formation protein